MDQEEEKGYFLNMTLLYINVFKLLVKKALFQPSKINHKFIKFCQIFHLVYLKDLKSDWRNTLILLLF